MYYDLISRSVLEIKPKTCIKLLQGLFTADLNMISEGEFTFSALLNAKGRFLYDFFIYKVEDDLLIDINKDSANEFIKTVSSYDILGEIQFKTLDHLKVLVDENFLPNWKNHLFRGRIFVEDKKDYILLEEEEYNIERIKLCLPDGNLELTNGKSIILEYGYDEACGISFEKGCYVGQELMNRTKRLGEIRKKLYACFSKDMLLHKGERILEENGIVLSVFGNFALILGQKAFFNEIELFDVNGIQYNILKHHPENSNALAY